MIKQVENMTENFNQINREAKMFAKSITSLLISTRH